MGTGLVDKGEVVEVVALVHDMCTRLDPTTIPLHDVPEVVDALATLERLGGGAVTRMAARYEEAGSWKRNGSRSVEDDLAKRSGTTTGEARRRMRTSKRLPGQPKTDQAVREGELSPEQADAVSSGADASPGEEDDLLESARKRPLHELRRRAADARARADEDREATRRRLHAQRAVRRWNDEEGMGNLLLKLPADEMAEVDAALKRPIDQRFADARESGRFEPHEAYAADVVKERLLGGSGADSPAKPNQAVRPDKKVIALIDVEALNRGHVEDGETCEIAGVGAVSVSAVRRLLSDAFLAVVIKDGVDILNVTHLGRQVTAHQRTALEARGGCCEICGSTFRVEIDHLTGWCLTRKTTIDDLGLKCWHCHDLKTRYGLRETGPPGDRTFVNRDGTPWRGPPDDAGADADAAVQDELFALAD